MITQSKEAKIQLLRQNLPRKAFKEVGEKHHVSRTTVWRALQKFDTTDPILQDLINLAHTNALGKTDAENKADEIAKLSNTGHA